MNLVEIIKKNAIEYKDKPVLADDSIPKGMSYEQFDIVSSKVYAYLKANDIGKEDFVMIKLPRSIKPIIALAGVWKNGSAFVIVEDDYAPERIEYIKNDCGCKLVIDANVWQEIQKVEPLDGYEKVDEHDAAFAVYTSGTTGNPKGVIHEYGNIDRMLDSVTMRSCKELADPDDKFALVAPLNFVASMLIIVYGLRYAIFNYVVSYKTIKNPLLLGMFIMMNGITGTFLTPSHIRKLGNKIKSLGLKFCIIGSEPANRVYLDGVTIHNFYLMSESGFAVSHFVIDKLYEQTPVGKSEFGHEILLLDEQGNPVKDGEEGEICFENKYVRGYMNLPEETSRVFKNGLYYSGDLARRDENGDLIICGRLSDMVKINGNRVEPGEIEGVAKKVLGIDWAAARIFDENGKVFIALYYTAKIKIDEDQTRKQMEKYLPYYMIPAFFVHIDSVPLRPNGKMDRKALPKPNFDDYKEDYVAPRDEIETALCEAMQKALGIERIGINDDFYQLGGDSLASMDVITNANLNGLTTTHIFRGHTVEKIAQIYKDEAMVDDGVDIVEYNKKCLEHSQPLSSEQLYMLDYQLYTPKSTMYNLYQMMKFDNKVIDMQKLADAVKVSALNHPAILTTFFFNEDGEPMQKYSKELWKDIKVEKISEKQLDEIKDDLVQPFNIMNNLLFRCRIFETEEAGYLFMDVHHTLFDGTSSKVFFGDILKAYFGQPLEPDYYYANLRKRYKDSNSDFYKESKEYFDNRYENKKWNKYPAIDHESRSNENDEVFALANIDNANFESFLKDNSLTPNAFFITASLIATSLYNKAKDVMVSWIYNGRSNATELNTVGLLFRNLPVALSINGKKKVVEVYKEVVEQINSGIEHSCYPYIEIGKNVVIDDLMCVLYQDDLREIADMPGLLGEVDIRRNNAASQNVLDLEVLNSKEGITLMFDYASSRYDKKTIEDYRDILNVVIECLIENGNIDSANIKTIVKNVYKKLGLFSVFKQWFMFGWLR